MQPTPDAWLVKRSLMVDMPRLLEPEMLSAAAGIL
jgi:hypothetical protein